MQHRGGGPGFLHVLDAHTIAFADLRGNRQYISLGNLSENPKVMLFLMDYAHRQRVKVWGTARVVEDDPELLRRLTPKGERAGHSHGRHRLVPARRARRGLGRVGQMG